MEEINISSARFNKYKGPLLKQQQKNMLLLDDDPLKSQKMIFIEKCLQTKQVEERKTVPFNRSSWVSKVLNGVFLKL